MTAEQIARYVVAEAVWAPSVLNTQPWRFTVGPDQISLHADTVRQLLMADPDGREMMISCGAALFTVRLALRTLGYVPQVRMLPEPGRPTLVARVSWPQRAPATEFERRLSGVVRRRRTHCGAFDAERLPPDLLAALRADAAREGATLRIMADDGRRAALAAAVQTAEHALQMDSKRVQELAKWTPAPDSARSDGVPATSYPARAEHTEPYFPTRDFAHGRGWGRPPLSSAAANRVPGVVGLLTTAADRPSDWVHAGQALQRIMLTATASGAAIALHSQPLELAWLREFIRTQLGDGAYPHLVLRIGTVSQVAVSVRREPTDVLSVPGGAEGERGSEVIAAAEDKTGGPSSPIRLPTDISRPLWLCSATLRT